MTQRWAIVGGGVLGLDLARRLHSGDRHITLYESAPTVGGLASAWQVGPVTWDKFYHVVLRSDAHTRGMLHRLRRSGTTDR